jgi:hypothetical protein
LVGSFSIATELLGEVSSIPAAKTLLKGESVKDRQRQTSREESETQSTENPRTEIPERDYTTSSREIRESAREESS